MIPYSVASGVDAFYSTLNKYFYSAVEIEWNQKLKQKKLIKTPEGVELVIAKIKSLDQNLSFKYSCLFYRVPQNKKLGILKFKPIKNDDCEKNLLEKSFVEVADIYNFTFELNEKTFDLYIDTKELKLKHAIEKFKKEGIVGSLLQSQKENTILKDGDICFDIGNSCEVLQKNECYLCPNGSYSVIASSCETASRKYCGIKDCGIKGSPACIRGFKATNLKVDYCFNDSPVGYCIDDSRVSCLNSELVCL